MSPAFSADQKIIMPRPAGSKVWNEDLVTAFLARAEMARQQGKRGAITWQEAANKIEAVRGDIYMVRLPRVDER